MQQHGFITCNRQGIVDSSPRDLSSRSTGESVTTSEEFIKIQRSWTCLIDLIGIFCVYTDDCLSAVQSTISSYTPTPIPAPVIRRRRPGGGCGWLDLGKQASHYVISSPGNLKSPREYFLWPWNWSGDSERRKSVAKNDNSERMIIIRIAESPQPQ